MKANEKLVGKIMFHPDNGKVSVDRVHGKSRTKVEVTNLDRGAGWCDITNKYKGVKTKGGWQRGQRHDFGETDVVHINELSKEL